MSLPGKLLISTLKKVPYVKRLIERIHEFEKYNGFPPGHYYSPLVEPQEYLEARNRLLSQGVNFPKEIFIDEIKQKEILRELKPLYDEMPFENERKKGYRYFLNNEFFSYSDAITLYGFIRLYKPKRIIEIGSGFSSALILDTTEHFLNNSVDLTFIDPNPERLFETLKKTDKTKILQNKIQDVDISVFKDLAEGDFLLIDTSHVSKSGSDVNHIYFNILPFLQKGVKIHIHDIFFPFEYPEKWVIQEKRSWNEIYFLRAFLTYNETFKIQFFNDFIQEKEKDYLLKEMPLFLERGTRICGGIWLEKIK